jgi:hypothetical protein
MENEVGMANEGNQSAFKHGREAAIKRLEDGRPLTGPAAEAQLSVKEDFEAMGATAMLQEQVERIHAVSRLYFDAFLTAIQAGDLAQADAFAARFGWLANSSVRAWEIVRKASDGKGARIGQVLDAYRKQETDDPTSE